VSVYLCKPIFRYRLSPQTFGYTLVYFLYVSNSSYNAQGLAIPICSAYLLLWRHVSSCGVGSTWWYQNADVYWLRRSNNCNTQSTGVSWVAVTYGVDLMLCKSCTTAFQKHHSNIELPW